MIIPEKRIWAEVIINAFINRKFDSRFSSVNYILENELLSDKSYLFIGNHSTWWDGFLGWKVNKDLIKKKYYVMMLEEQLRRFWFFQKCGAFSIQPSSRSMIESLKFAAGLLKDNHVFLQFYPQGKLHSLFDTEFVFNKGAKYLIDSSPNYLFYAAFVDYGPYEKPYLNVFLCSILHKEVKDAGDMEKLYKEFYKRSLEKHIKTFKS